MALAAIVVMTGAIAFRWSVLRRWPAARAAPLREWNAFVAGAGALAAACVLVAAPVRLYAQAVGLTPADDPVLPMMWNVMQTMWGRGLELQTAAALAMLTGLLCARRNLQWGWSLGLLAAAGIALSPALMGHAIAADSWLAATVVADWIHVLMAGAWVGTLAVLTLIARRATRGGAGVDSPIALLIELFHPVALVCSAVLVVAGVLGLFLRVHSIGDLIHSSYGAVLAVKLALTLGLAALGLHHSRHGARLARAGETARVVRSLTAEAMLAAAVIAATAVLVGTSPPMPS